jgi:hypothetical protein
VAAGVRHGKPLALEGCACKAYSLGCGFAADGCTNRRFCRCPHQRLWPCATLSCYSCRMAALAVIGELNPLKSASVPSFFASERGFRPKLVTNSSAKPRYFEAFLGQVRTGKAKQTKGFGFLTLLLHSFIRAPWTMGRFRWSMISSANKSPKAV